MQLLEVPPIVQYYFVHKTPHYITFSLLGWVASLGGVIFSSLLLAILLTTDLTVDLIFCFVVSSIGPRPSLLSLSVNIKMSKRYNHHHSVYLLVGFFRPLPLIVHHCRGDISANQRFNNRKNQ